MISCILLSAGLSSRFKDPKSLAKINNRTVIESLQKMLLNSQVDEIIIVLGAHAKQVKAYILNHKRINFVYNKFYYLGQTSSFKTGLQAVSTQSNGIMLLPVDYPVIKSETINELIAVFKKNLPSILIPSFEGKKGHPPIFHTKLKKEFLNLEDSLGLNTIARHHQKDTTLLPVNDSGVIKTFNTPEEFEKI